MNRAHISPYALSYTLWYLGLTVLVAFIFTLLGWPGGVGTILLIAFAASWITGKKFARRQGRAPSSIEAHAYSWRSLVGSFITTAGISTALALLVFPAQEVQLVLNHLLRLDYILAGIGVMLVMGAIYYLIIRLAFGWAAMRSVPY